MTQKITLWLLFTLFFTACVERGYAPKPVTNTLSTPIIKKDIKASTPTKDTLLLKSVETVKSIVTSKTIEVKVKVKKILKKQVISPERPKATIERKKDIFTLTDETKNKISGFFILIIGLIILL